MLADELVPVSVYAFTLGVGVNPVSLSVVVIAPAVLLSSSTVRCPQPERFAL